MVKIALSHAITRFVSNKPVTAQDSPSIGVRHKEWMPARVEQDGIHSLGAESLDLQQFPASLRGLKSKEPSERTTTRQFKPVQEAPDCCRLLSIESSTSNMVRQCLLRCLTEPMQIQQDSLTELTKGLIGVAPCSVLGQDRAQNDFQACSRRPPVLGAKVAEQSLVILEQQGCACQMRSSRNRNHRARTYTGGNCVSRKGSARQDLSRQRARSSPSTPGNRLDFAG